MGWLEGRTALITGGASGLGHALVERFLQEGAHVGVFDKSQERLSHLEAEMGKQIVTIQGDVRHYSDNQRAVSSTVERFGKLDIFVGNAGIWDYSLSLVDLPEEKMSNAFDELFGINVKGYLLGAKAAVRELAKTQGNIIFTVSNAGFYVAGGGPLYTASKHAVVGIIRQLAFELAPKIRVNGVAPGAISTDLRGPASLEMDKRKISDIPLADFLKDALPLPRLPEAKDYTGPYVLLASDANSGTATGTIINCDGGIGVRGFPRPAGGYNL